MTTTTMRRLYRRLRPDRGSTTVEMVGYFAVMLASLLVGVQAAAWGLAELSCRYAANHAVQTTRVLGGSAADGQTDANTVLTAIDGQLVTDAHIQTSRGPATATVTVSGTAVQVIPFLHLPVRATITAPVENLTPQALGFTNPVPAAGN
jgi:hypothetical protein